MDFNIYNDKKELIYGNCKESEYKNTVEIEKQPFIVKGFSNFVEVPVMTRLISELAIPCDTDFVNLLNNFNTKYFAGVKIYNPKPDCKQFDGLRFDVNETVQAILSQEGKTLHLKASGSIECIPKFRKETDVSIYYTLPKNEIEFKFNNHKFKALNRKQTISAYSFVPTDIPIQIYKKPSIRANSCSETYILKSCLSDRSKIQILFPKKGIEIEATAEFGKINILKDSVYWEIENINFHQTEIHISYKKSNKSYQKAPITVKFESFCFSLSELLITSVHEDKKKDVWVNYNCKSLDYEIREK